MSYSIRVSIPLVLDSIFQLSGAVSMATSIRYCELIFKKSDNSFPSVGSIRNVDNKKLKNEIKSYVEDILKSPLLPVNNPDMTFELSIEIKHDTGQFSKNEMAMICAGIICGVNYFYKNGANKQENVDIATNIYHSSNQNFYLSSAVACINGGMISMIDTADCIYFKTNIPQGIFLSFCSLGEDIADKQAYTMKFCMGWSGFNAAMFNADFRLIRECMMSMSGYLDENKKVASLLSHLKDIAGFTGYTTAGENQLVVITDNTLAMESTKEIMQNYKGKEMNSNTVYTAYPDKEGIIKI